jgi:hypothetical protein
VGRTDETRDEWNSVLAVAFLLMGCGPYYHESKTYDDIGQKPFDLDSDSTRVFYYIEATPFNTIIPFFHHKHVEKGPYSLRIRILSTKASIEGSEVRFRSAKMIFPDGAAYDLPGPEDGKRLLMVDPSERGWYECEFNLKLSPVLNKHAGENKFKVALEIKLPGAGDYVEVEQQFESHEEKWRGTMFMVFIGS